MWDSEHHTLSLSSSEVWQLIDLIVQIFADELQVCGLLLLLRQGSLHKEHWK